MAIREDELAAAANGINTVVTKLLAFALGATTRASPACSTPPRYIVSADQFLFTVSFTVLAMVVLGGMGNIWGVAVGAFIVYKIQAVLLKSLKRSSPPAGRSRSSRTSTSSSTSTCCTAWRWCS